MKSGRARLIRCPGGDASAEPNRSLFQHLESLDSCPVRHRGPYHVVPAHLFASIDWSAFLLGDNHVSPVTAIYSSFLPSFAELTELLAAEKDQHGQTVSVTVPSRSPGPAPVTVKESVTWQV